MKKLVFLTITCFLLSIPNLAICGDWTGNINAFLGVKALDEDDWEPIEDQDEYGIKVDFKQKDWPVSIAIEYLVSSDDDTGLWYDPVIGIVIATVEGETSELCFGVRKIWDQSPKVRPFIGGGIAHISAEAKATTLGFSASDDAIGIWIGGGVYWTLGEHFNIGFDVRWSKAEVSSYNIDAEAGGSHAGLLLGFHW
ncbi:hypothetical protein ES703_124015 [subsurface metagenome]